MFRIQRTFSAHGLETLHQFCGCNCNVTLRRSYRVKGATREKALQDHMKQYDLQEEISRLTAVLGIVPSKAAALVKKMPDIYKISEQKFKGIMSVFQDCGFDPQQALLKCPRMLMHTEQTVKTKAEIFMESGVQILNNPQLLAQLPTILRKSPSYLKKRYLMPKVINVEEEYRRYLGTVSNPNISSSCNHEEISLSDLRRKCLLEYFTQVLHWEPDISYAAIQSQSMVFSVPLHNLTKRVQVLQERWKFDCDFLSQHPELLLEEAQHTMSLLETMESAGVAELSNCIRQLPMLMKRLTPQRVTTVLNLLSRHELDQRILKSTPELLSLQPDTVAQRLEKIEGIPSLQVLRTNPRFGDIIYSLPRVLKHIKKLDSPDSYTGAWCLHYLISTDSMFDQYVQANASHANDIANFLSHYFPTQNNGDILEQLQRHPHFKHSSLLTVQDSMNYLLGLRIPRDSIFTALPVVLYPRNVISSAANSLIQNEGVDLKLPYFLHLVLYEIEKPFGFSGEGIFLSRPDSGLDEMDITQEDIDLEHRWP